jgi:predicted RNA-binding protein with RPS1 domain
MSEIETFSTVPAVSDTVPTQAVEGAGAHTESHATAGSVATAHIVAEPAAFGVAPITAPIAAEHVEVTAIVTEHGEAQPIESSPPSATPPIANEHVDVPPVVTESAEEADATEQGGAPSAHLPASTEPSANAETRMPAPADGAPAEKPRDPRAPRTVGFDRSVEERKQRAEQHWLHVSGARDTGEALEGLVTATVKGGLLVDVGGVRGFLPASQTRLEAGAALESLVKTKVPLCVIDVDAKRRRIVVSQRRALDDLRRSKRTALLRSLQIGQLHEGVVVRLAPFGAFVDIGGLEGLVPMSELAFERVERVEDVLKVGERIQVTVLRLDESGKKIGLSRKNALPDPLRDHAALLRTGNVIEGKVVGKDSRLEVEIAPGVIGSVRETDADPAQYEIGETVEVSVRYVDRRNRRIVLTTLHGVAAVAPQSAGFASLGEELRRRK